MGLAFLLVRERSGGERELEAPFPVPNSKHPPSRFALRWPSHNPPRIPQPDGQTESKKLASSEVDRQSLEFRPVSRIS
jgi:hypothetical protein